MTTVHVVRGRDRFRTAADGIETFHAFSFGAHYDPANTGFGVLAAHNDENLAPSSGFAAHPHRDQEIVTWVVDGALEHRDASGRQVLLTPGMAQWQGSGSGITHAEVNASADRPLRFIQVWLTPDGYGLDPGYAFAAVDLPPNRLVPVASGSDPGAALPRLRQNHATCHAARLTPGATIDLPAARYLHVFVVRGSVTASVGRPDIHNAAVDGAAVDEAAVGLAAADLAAAAEPLGPGDSVRLTGAGAVQVTCLADAELLVWAMTASSADLLSSSAVSGT